MIVEHAHAVLDVAQEPRALVQQAGHIARSDPVGARDAQCARSTRSARLGVLVTVRELEDLRGKLDIDDATREVSRSCGHPSSSSIRRRTELPFDGAERGLQARLRDHGELAIHRERIERAGEIGEPTRNT